ncbi:MAG: hypothetical protein HY565_03585 [Candidatus Kerfeldbacteria bacterium]|nr:hypothetical protein [Candidatus Kerfeldbacteria bacterium]
MTHPLDGDTTVIESKHGSHVLVLPPQTLRMAEYESGLRWHWPTLDLLMGLGLLTQEDIDLLSIGMKNRHPDPDIFFVTTLGFTETEVAEWTGDDFRRVLGQTARMKSGYVKPAEGPVDLRQAVCDRYVRRFGVEKLDIGQVLYLAGGCSQALDVVIQNLFLTSGIVPTDTSYWPGIPGKIVRHGPTPVSMFRCHESFDDNRKYLAPLIDRDIAGVYVSFPGNPIGLRLTPERLEVLTRTRLWLRDRCIEANKPAPFWVSDGVYMDQPAETLSLLAGQDSGDVIEVYGLTKGRLQAGNRDSFLVVGNSAVLRTFVSAQARDGLSGNVPWHYPKALARAIRDANGFLAHERELDQAAGAAFEAEFVGVDGLSIDPAVDDQYRYVHVAIPEDRQATTEDWKRWHILEAAANKTRFVDWIPGPYFNHPLMLRASGIRIHEVDGIRTIMAFPPDKMQRAARVIVRTWNEWQSEGFTKVPTWSDLVTLLKAGIMPRQILDDSRDGTITATLERVKSGAASPDNGVGKQAPDEKMVGRV